MSGKKIILAVTTDLNFDQRVQRIAKSLAEQGNDVWVIGRELPSSPPLIPTKYNQYRLKCFIHKGFLFYAEYNLRLFFYLLFKKYDFVTANDLDTIVGVFFSSFLKKCTLVFDAHEYFTEVPELANRKTVKQIWSMVERVFVPKFDKHYTVNKSLSYIFKQKTGKDFRIVHNVPYSLENEAKQEYSAPYLLYQGAVNKGRGLENLIKAMPYINIPLKIAGDGDIMPDLKKLVEELSLQNKVDFLGKIPPKELPELTRHATIGVNLLENTSLNYYYSLANKFFDYIQAEVPQISMNFPEYKLINDQYNVAILLDNIDSSEISDKINNLMNNKELFLNVKQNCTAAKKEFCWEIEQEKLKEIYS
jgi:glycosyltransferase involved in cell wall biosynthesis